MQSNADIDFLCQNIKNMSIPLDQHNIDLIKESARVNAETYSVRNSVWSHAFHGAKYEIPIATNEVHYVTKNSTKSSRS